MNLDDVRKNPAFYTACGWCYAKPGYLDCTCTGDCKQPHCPAREEVDLLPRPKPIPTFVKEAP